jgi:type II secretory pathway pseudopilin PulG
VIALNIKREEAFTLIEVMLSIVLITLILGVLFNLNLSGWKFWKINQDSVELSQLTTLISENLDKKIRASSIQNEQITIIKDGNNDILKIDANSDNNDDYIYKFDKNNFILINNINNQKKTIIDSKLKKANFHFIYIYTQGKQITGRSISDLQKELDKINKNDDENNYILKREDILVEYKIVLENNKELIVSKQILPRV